MHLGPMAAFWQVRMVKAPFCLELEQQAELLPERFCLEPVQPAEPLWELFCSELVQPEESWQVQRLACIWPEPVRLA